MNLTPKDGDDGVCLLIHNIDGPALRDAESQQCLAQVSCCPHICIVASVDHVNAPLCKFMALTPLASSLSNSTTVYGILTGNY